MELSLIRACIVICSKSLIFFRGIKNVFHFIFSANLPKEVMAFPDFPYPEQENSFLSRDEVVNYLESYAVHYNIKKYIKFEHYVVRVRPIENEEWEVIVRDLPNDKYETLQFDAIMVCNGHYSDPLLPDFPGQSIFKGKQIHSNVYRFPEVFDGMFEVQIFVAD